MGQRQYLCIDQKSFYASVECIERGLNPLITNLVVADKSRTEKTICLAVSPALIVVFDASNVIETLSLSFPQPTIPKETRATKSNVKIFLIVFNIFFRSFWGLQRGKRKRCVLL